MIDIRHRFVMIAPCLLALKSNPPRAAFGTAGRSKSEFKSVQHGCLFSLHFIPYKRRLK